MDNILRKLFFGGLTQIKKQRKEQIMLVLGMCFAVLVAVAAEVGVVNNKLA